MKKRKAIDLMLDGLISKEDLQSQTEWYNEELEKLEYTTVRCFTKRQVGFSSGKSYGEVYKSLR